MNIALLSTHINLGGIGIYIKTLAKGLVNRGHKVFVISSGGELAQAIEGDGAELIQVDVKTKSEIHPKLIPAGIVLTDEGIFVSRRGLARQSVSRLTCYVDT